MIPKTFRLSGRKNIDQVKDAGMLVQSDTFGLFYLDNSFKNPRFCIVVSKKISTKATVRNKVRRMVRFNLMQLVSRVKRGYDLIFLMKGRVLGVDSVSFGKELEDVLNREGII